MTTHQVPHPLGNFSQAAYGYGIAPINAAIHRSGEFVAVVHFADKSRGQSTKAQKAYALPFAAAPELLAELEYAHEIVTVLLNLVPPERKAEMAGRLAQIHDSEGAVRYHERRAAIAKAKGEQA